MPKIKIPYDKAPLKAGDKGPFTYYGQQYASYDDLVKAAGTDRLAYTGYRYEDVSEDDPRYLEQNKVVLEPVEVIGNRTFKPGIVVPTASAEDLKQQSITDFDNIVFTGGELQGREVPTEFSSDGKTSFERALSGKRDPRGAKEYRANLEAIGMNPIFGNTRVQNFAKTEKKNPYFMSNWDIVNNVCDVANMASAGFINRLSPTQNIRLIADTVQGDNVMQSWFGNNGIVSDNFAQNHPWISAGINLIGDGGVYLIPSAIKSISKPFSVGYNLYHSIGKHPRYRWDMMNEGRNLLNNKLITLEEALQIPKTKIKIADDFFWTPNKIFIKKGYNPKKDFGFGLRHELAHQTQNKFNLKQFKNSSIYSEKYRYNYKDEDKLFRDIGDYDRMLERRLSEQRADWLGTLGGRITLKQALGNEGGMITQTALRLIKNPQLFKSGSMFHLDYGDARGAFGNSRGSFIKNNLLFPGKAIKPDQLDYTWFNLDRPYSWGNNNKPFTRMIIFDKEDIPNLLHVRSQNYPIGQWNGKSGFVLNSEYVTSSPIDMKKGLVFQIK